jgi:hypothetical protein
VDGEPSNYEPADRRIGSHPSTNRARTCRGTETTNRRSRVADAIPWLRVITINWNLQSDLGTVV